MNHQQAQDQQQIAEGIVAKCWSDEAFKQRLMTDPAGTLKAEGLTLSDAMSAEMLENTVQALALAIPARSTDLSDEQLSKAAAGGDIGSSFQNILASIASSMT